jgi:hypothetical protein
MHISRIIITSAATLALAAGGTAAATAAGARPGTTNPSVHTWGDMHLSTVQLPRTHLPHPRLVHSVLLSGNWSGWAVERKAAYQTQYITATFNVPSVNCANSVIGTSGISDDAEWAGLDGLNSNTVEQDGVDGYCTSTTGAPTYYAWYEMYPLAPVAFTGSVSPGDAIQVIVRYLGGGVFNLILNDLTQHAGFNVNQSCPSGSTCLKSSAEVITEDPGGAVPAVDLPDYGMENFTNARTAFGSHSGSLLTSTYWTGGIEIVMEDPSAHVMAQPSTLFGGQAFSTIWKTGT